MPTEAGAGAVLVDTSVWIRFFRVPQSEEALELDRLLAIASVATCAPIRAEVVSGAPTLHEFRRLRELFGALAFLELPQDLWARIEAHRFALARRGYQAALVDLMIALTAHVHRIPLWTLDQDFRRMTAGIPVRTYHAVPFLP